MPEDFISEPISPIGDARDRRAMGRGEPGLPSGFRWRDAAFTVVDRVEAWKTSSPECGKAGNEVYLRRHYYALRMSDGKLWTVYFTRQPISSRSKARWFLYTIEE
jgi:hypothetical protein